MPRMPKPKQKWLTRYHHCNCKIKEKWIQQKPKAAAPPADTPPGHAIPKLVLALPAQAPAPQQPLGQQVPGPSVAARIWQPWEPQPSCSLKSEQELAELPSAAPELEQPANRASDNINDDGSGNPSAKVQRSKNQPPNRFTTVQYAALETEFVKNKYISNPTRTRLSLQLELTETQVGDWFKNRRKRRTRWMKNLCSAYTNDDRSANPSAKDEKSKKQPPTRFTAVQYAALESEYEKNQYIPNPTRTRLSLQHKLKETQIKDWFRNRRSRPKKKGTTI